jgi:RNA polymerase sigma-54 factor
MVLLQPKLHLKVSQRQILTPGLVQMVSVLALNKLELRDMITAEMVENPVLEELEDSVPLLDDAARREEERERVAPEENTITAVEKKDPFEEIDFGSFFQEYLDPGYRSRSEMEEIERPSFENFLSKPTTLTDHLAWQLGALSVTPEVREAAEVIIGNLSEDGYLIASDEELLGTAPPTAPEVDATIAANVVKEAAALGLATDEDAEEDATAASEVKAGASEEIADTEIGIDRGIDTATGVDPFADAAASEWNAAGDADPVFSSGANGTPAAIAPETSSADMAAAEVQAPAAIPAAAPPPDVAPPRKSSQPAYLPSFKLGDLHEALDLVRQMDPPGVACRDLRDCLLYQLRYHQHQLTSHKNGNGEAVAQVLSDAVAIVDLHLRALQNKQYKEIARAINRPPEAVQEALEYIRTLDPRPGLRYNKSQPRLIEPDVAFIKHGDEWLVMMNEDDVPVLRLNPAYKRLLTRDTNDKDTRNYVKERYKSAIQLIKNIEQRKQTITKVCYSIVTRQQDFLEKGIDQLKPMMIKEVAEEIGVHPSTVSRAVANKYAHTPQGVFELRYFFSESVNGPQGGNTSLLILKRRVKKLIEEEDPNRPLTDEQITRILQSQGIQVTRRTVAKYREDMRIPSTHQRRVKK